MRVVVWGIDPGLRDTGIVCFTFDWSVGSRGGTLTIRYFTYSDQIKMLADISGLIGHQPSAVFIEDYRVRAGHRENKPMLELITKLRVELHKKSNVNVTALNNMGIKKIVTADLMKVLQVWDFPTPTHHQDLRSAARIALFGMIKDSELNQVLSDWFVDNVIPGARPWVLII